MPLRFIGFTAWRDYIIAINEHGDVYRLEIGAPGGPRWSLLCNGPYPFPPEAPR